MRSIWIPGVLLLLAGCADPKRDARAVAQEFVSAVERGDLAARDERLTRAARERGMAVLFRPGATSPIKVDGASVDGTSAKVALTDPNGEETGALLLRQEDGHWRVWGVQAVPKDSPFGPLTLSFERPEASLKEFGHVAGESLGGLIKGFVDGLEKGLSESARK